jgi:SSS family solute:Na+ symporter
VFIFLLPGMIAVALYKQGRRVRVDRRQSAGRVPGAGLEPAAVGLRGLVLAGMLSALMSALASLFNSTATLFTVDFYKRLRPQSSERHLVFVGRLATAIVILLGMAWIPFLQDLGKGQLYTILQLVQSLLAPSIAAGFMLGIFSRGVTPHSGLIGIATGFVVGMIAPGICRPRTRCITSSGRASCKRSSTSTGCTSASCCSLSRAC